MATLTELEAPEKEAYGRVAILRRGSLVALKNTHLEVSYDLSVGVLHAANDAGHYRIRNVAAGWVRDDGREFFTTDPILRTFYAGAAFSERFGAGARIVVEHDHRATYARTDLILELYTDQPFFLVRLEVHNNGNKAFRVLRMHVLDSPAKHLEEPGGVLLGADPTECWFYLNSSKLMARGVQQIERGELFPAELSEEPVSDGILFHPRQQTAVTFGFLSGGRWWSSAQVGYDPSSYSVEPEEHPINIWRVFQVCDKVRCGPKERIASEPLYVNLTTPASQAQFHFAGTVFPSEKRWELQPRVVSVYFQPDEERLPMDSRIREFLKWADAQGAELLRGPYGLAELRLGWGWDPPDPQAFQQQFPQGVPALVEAIHRAGFQVGAEGHTYVLEDEAPEEFREALITRRGGQPVAFSSDTFSECYVLDPTHPLTREYLIRRFQQVYHTWKLDSFYTTLQPFRDFVGGEMERYRWYRSDLTRMELLAHAHRLLLEVRDEVAPGAVLGIAHVPLDVAFMGHYRSSLGLDPFYDSASSSWDGPWGLRELLRSFTAKWYTHRHWWEAELGPITFLQGRPLNECHVLLTLGLLGGGHLCLRDDLTALERDELRLLARCLPLTEGDTQVIPLENPQVYAWVRSVAKPFDEWTLLALVNLSDYYEDIDVPLGEIGLSRARSYVAYEFWDQVLYGIHQRTFSVVALPPRSAKLFALREERPVPIFLSSDVHVAQGAVELQTIGWDEKSQTLLGVYRPDGRTAATLYFYVPERFVPAGVSCAHAKYSYTWRVPLFELHLAAEEGREVPFAIRFVPAVG
ncbi:MAG: hypothetical protein KatS3mg115_0494 [Candidatus Poribacteria bacterium]|nr:MAG: hypothetical protein KatS3mg115_0494 [Candidatus Poribacteria bacterium]